MPIKIVHFTEEEYKMNLRGLKLLRSILWIADQNWYEEIAMARLQALLHHERCLIQDIKEEIPFEGEDDDMKWWLEQLVKVYENFEDDKEVENEKEE